MSIVKNDNYISFSLGTHFFIFVQNFSLFFKFLTLFSYSRETFTYRTLMYSQTKSIYIWSQYKKVSLSIYFFYSFQKIFLSAFNITVYHNQKIRFYIFIYIFISYIISPGKARIIFIFYYMDIFFSFIYFSKMLYTSIL